MRRGCESRRPVAARVLSLSPRAAAVSSASSWRQQLAPAVGAARSAKPVRRARAACRAACRAAWLRQQLALLTAAAGEKMALIEKSLLVTYLFEGCEILSIMLVELLGDELRMMLVVSKQLIVSGWFGLPCCHASVVKDCAYCDWQECAGKDVAAVGLAAKVEVRRTHLARLALALPLSPDCVYYLCPEVDLVVDELRNSLWHSGPYRRLGPINVPVIGLPLAKARECEERLVCLLYDTFGSKVVYRLRRKLCDDDGVQLYKLRAALSFNVTPGECAERSAVEQATSDEGVTWTRDLWEIVKTWFVREWRSRHTEPSATVEFYVSGPLRVESVLHEPMDWVGLTEEVERLREAGGRHLFPAQYRAMDVLKARSLPSIFPIHALRAQLASLDISVVEPTAEEYEENPDTSEFAPVILLKAQSVARNGKTYSLTLAVTLNLDNEEWKWDVFQAELESV